MTSVSLTVLSIEDQADIQTILAIALEATGKLKVLKASTGSDGIQMAQDYSPDLILLDFSLPDMDGPDVMKRLQEAEVTKSIPVIMLTAKTGDFDLEECKNSGAVDVLIKPFLPQDIGRQVLEIYKKHSGEPA